MTRRPSPSAAARQRLRASADDIADRGRLLLAGKTALAAVLAWYLAPLLPIADDQYSYYAPLGVLVSMYPTVARSALSGAQALIGLILGIGLGLAALAMAHAGVPGGVALGVVVLAGTIASGIRVLGVGRDWVALAGLFVLLLGGRDVEGFSVSYLMTMAFGVLVGVAVNLLVVPPLYFDRASARLSRLRDAVAGQLRALADGVAERDIDGESIDPELAALRQAVESADAMVQEADESRRANPRGRRYAGRQSENLERMRALDRSALHTRELGEVLERMTDAGDAGLDAPSRGHLAEAIRRTADLVATPLHDAEAAGRLDAAVGALARFGRSAPSQPRTGRHVADSAAAMLFLEQIIDDCRPFV
jgi:uncharacterized membrane protein YgaE (UPF0421/DUF939 family)